MASERIKKYGMVPVEGDVVLDNNEPKIVTQDTLHQYTVYDVALPMPGHSVIYPTNEIGQCYVEYMGQHGFHPDKMTSKIHETNLPGSYRYVVCRPTNVEW
jgi:tRNA pseudouridine13 synthase